MSTPVSRRAHRKAREQAEVLERRLSYATDKQLLLLNKLIAAEARIAAFEAASRATRICVACNTCHPLDHFDQTSPDFPTRDGLQYNCRASLASATYRLERLPNGRVEPAQ